MGRKLRSYGQLCNKHIFGIYAVLLYGRVDVVAIETNIKSISSLPHRTRNHFLSPLKLSIRIALVMRSTRYNIMS
jgi:hypothetical protein